MLAINPSESERLLYLHACCSRIPAWSKTKMLTYSSVLHYCLLVLRNVVCWLVKQRHSFHNVKCYIDNMHNRTLYAIYKTSPSTRVRLSIGHQNLLCVLLSPHKMCATHRIRKPMIHWFLLIIHPLCVSLWHILPSAQPLRVQYSPFSSVLTLFRLVFKFCLDLVISTIFVCCLGNPMCLIWYL